MQLDKAIDTSALIVTKEKKNDIFSLCQKQTNTKTIWPVYHRIIELTNQVEETRFKNIYTIYGESSSKKKKNHLFCVPINLHKILSYLVMIASIHRHCEPVKLLMSYDG